jgi:flagellar biosynthesis/type III secretory pathway protein FliH
MISQSDRERELYESREKMRRDIAFETSEAHATGLQKGLEKGFEKGRAEGRAEERVARWRDDVRYLQDALGHRVTSAEELQALPLPELESLAARLRSELKARLVNGS